VLEESKIVAVVFVSAVIAAIHVVLLSFAVAVIEYTGKKAAGNVTAPTVVLA
jgi:hypothetical protein